MKRLIYQCLLALHPPAFRRRFAEEMLWIFDQKPATRFLADAILSLIRQWLLRGPLWKIAAALAGAFGTVYLSAMLLLVPKPSARLNAYPLNTPQSFLMVAGLTSILIVSLTLVLGVSWFRYSRRRCV